MALFLFVLHSSLWAVGTLAMHQTQVAVRALGVILFHAKQGEAREHTQKCAQRAKCAAPAGQVRVVVTRVQKGKISSAAVVFPIKGDAKKTVTIQLKKVN